MWFFVAILLALSPAILYGLMLVFMRVYRRRCPTCGKRALTLVNFFRATIAINGKRAPDFWSYFECDNCGAAFKLHRDAWTHVSKDEIERFRPTLHHK